MRTVILDKPYHHIFEDAARYFTAMSGEDTLCFGVQDWNVAEIQTQRELATGVFIAYQSELLYAGNMPFRNSLYAEKLKLFDEIWDYSAHNVDFLKQNGVTNVQYRPLMPTEVLKDTPVKKDIDILHYGSWSRHRAEYLNAAIIEGFQVYDLLFVQKKMLYGEDLHQLIRRSKVVLGLHYYPQSPQQESFRYQYPLSNNIKILAEKSLSNPLDLDEFASTGEMIEKLKQIVHPRSITRDELLDRWIFAQYSSYLEEAEKNTSSNSLSDKLSYSVEYMNADLDVTKEMRYHSKRNYDIRIIENKSFDDLIRIVRTLILERKELNHHTISSISKKSRQAYCKLNKKTLKEELLSTGGKLMPQLRCILLLHGWTLMRISLLLAIILRKDHKLIHYISKQAIL